MERSEEAKDKVVVDTREAVGQDIEKKSRTKQSLSSETKNGYRGETDAKEEEVQGGEAGGADPPREWSKEGEYPGRGHRTAEEGETSEETKKDEFHRPPLVAAPTDPIAPTAQIIGMQGLLRRWASEGVHGLACEVRVRSTEEQPRPPDQEMSRGRSMR